MQQIIEQFLEKYLTAPKGTSHHNFVEKIAHWISVCNHPEQFYPKADPFELRVRRRNARQNIRRLLNKHPELISSVTQYMQESQVSQ